MELTLKQMRYACAVADHGHFGKAAQACHVTQSALSQQIRTLEDICGTALFDRMGKQVRTTPFGTEFVSRARRILSESESLVGFAAGHDGNPTHPLRFGLIPTVAPYLLPSLYPALRSAMPEIDFQIVERHTEDLLDRLDKAQLDLALIATDPPNAARLETASLFADPFVLASSHDNALPDPLSLAHLPKDRILLLDEGHCLRNQAIEACALRDLEAGKAFAATSLSTIVEFVANGQGITLLPAISLKKEAADPRIRISPLADPGAGRTLRLVWQRATPFADLFEKIATIIRETTEQADAATKPLSFDPAQ